jgi:hypothetical protein
MYYTHYIVIKTYRRDGAVNSSVGPLTERSHIRDLGAEMLSCFTQPHDRCFAPPPAERHQKRSTTFIHYTAS